MSQPTKAKLQGHKSVKIDGQKFIIRKINPVLDFMPEQMPQIFTAMSSRRDMSQTVNPKVILDQMMRIVEAAVVCPALIPVGKGESKGREAGLTVEDIFRDEETGSRLFAEVMIHSLNRFKGLKSLFFSVKTRLLFWIASLGVIPAVRPISPLNPKI